MFAFRIVARYFVIFKQEISKDPSEVLLQEKKEQNKKEETCNQKPKEALSP